MITRKKHSSTKWKKRINLFWKNQDESVNHKYIVAPNRFFKRHLWLVFCVFIHNPLFIWWSPLLFSNFKHWFQSSAVFTFALTFLFINGFECSLNFFSNRSTFSSFRYSLVVFRLFCVTKRTYLYTATVTPQAESVLRPDFSVFSFTMNLDYSTLHFNSVISHFSDQFRNEEFLDCTLNAEGKSIRVHRAVLCAQSTLLEVSKTLY